MFVTDRIEKGFSPVMLKWITRAGCRLCIADKNEVRGDFNGLLTSGRASGNS